MAQALFDRLNVVFSDTPEQQVVSQREHWPTGGFARRINDVLSVIVHETSGWPTRKHGENMFGREFFGGNAHAAHKGKATQLYVAGDGTVLLGMTLPLATYHATFTNIWALGSETGHGWGNYRGNDHIGPFSQSDHTKNANGVPIPPYGQFRALHAMPQNGWRALSGAAPQAVIRRNGTSRFRALERAAQLSIRRNHHA